MLGGVPVVVTDVPGARWLVKTTGAGKIVPPENASALARAITDVLTHHNVYQQKTSKAKEIFNNNKFLDEYESLFRK
jgi:glycosyltransferase involved in cell wall biosynthesis